MRGAEHYAEAERLVAAAAKHVDGDPQDHTIAQDLGLAAQVHATLALAAAVERAGDSAHGYGTPGYGR